MCFVFNVLWYVFFKQKTAYEMRISDWSSDVCSSDLVHAGHQLSISETYLREGATCRSVSIEHWGPAMEVHSYARTHVGTNARVIESNIQVSPVKHHYSQSRTVIEDGGVSNDQSVIFAQAGTGRVLASEHHLKGVTATAAPLARTNRKRVVKG